MALKDIFTMIKADRYTADGCAEINKALANETEDVRYNIGDISQKTGLQKTANGWVKPKKGGAGKGAGEPTLGISETDRKSYEKAVKNVDTWRLKEAFEKREGKELSPEAKAKHEIIKSELAKRSEIAKQADFEKKVGDPAKEREQYWKEIKEASETPMPGVEEIYNKTVGSESEEDITSGYSLTREEHDMDTLKANAKNIPALQPLVRQREPFFQKKLEAYKKLKENPSNPKARADFVDATNAINQIDADIDRAYKKATSEDAAPRCLTGDCKIRVRKSR